MIQLLFIFLSPHILVDFIHSDDAKYLSYHIISCHIICTVHFLLFIEVHTNSFETQNNKHMHIHENDNS